MKQNLRGGAASAEFGAVDFVAMHSHPNFWFHVVTAYDLLRGLGLDIGKEDFLNGARLHEWKILKA